MNQKMTQAGRPEKNEDFFRGSNFLGLKNYKFSLSSGNHRGEFLFQDHNGIAHRSIDISDTEKAKNKIQIISRISSRGSGDVNNRPVNFSKPGLEVESHGRL
jgi:hypothetical protein